MSSPGTEGREDQPDLGLDQFETSPDDHGLSLDELSSAYAQLMGQGDVPFESDAAADDDDADEAAGDPFGEGDGGEGRAANDCELSPLTIVEAILFMGHPENEPITATEIAELMRGVRPQEIDGIVCDLNEIYQEEGCPYHVVADGAGYRLSLKPEFGPLRESFYGRVREARLTQAALDVLAIVAYNEGIARDRIEEIRGKPCAGVLSQMVRRQLLRMERSEDAPRKPRYHTTPRFLHLFGLDRIEDLPRSPDFDGD